MNRPLHILVVDDIEPESMAAVLRFTGDGKVTTTTATTLKDAMEESGKSKFSAVLLDLNLPDAHGTEAVVKFQQEYPETPVVVISGDNDPDLVEACTRAGAQEFITKTSDPKDFEERIRHAVLRHEVRPDLKPPKAMLELKDTLEKLSVVSDQLEKRGTTT